MTMRFESDFQVPGAPDEVIRLFADVPLMATFLPGASVDEPNPDGSYPGTLVVSFGPKRIGFKGTVLNTVDPANHSGVATGQGNADVRGAKLAVKLTYKLSSLPGEAVPTTHVQLVSEAQLSGLLAEFARTGGVALTNAILAEFSRRFAAHVAADQTAGAQAPPPPPAQSLSAFALFGEMLRMWFRRIFGLGGQNSGSAGKS
jgi:carbon monoxide dehydrogenase subunit G